MNLKNAVSNMENLMDFINNQINESLSLKNVQKWEAFCLSNYKTDDEYSAIHRLNEYLSYMYTQDEKVAKRMEKDGQLKEFFEEGIWDEWFDDDYEDLDDVKEFWLNNYKKFFKVK